MRFPAIAAVLACLACSDPEPPQVTCTEPGVEAYTDGFTRATQGGGASVRIQRASPAVPSSGANVWILEVLDPAGNAVRAEALRLRAWRPTEGRGSDPLWSDAVPLVESVSYRVGPFVLHVPGAWELTAEVTLGGVTDEARFTFCVQGEALDGGVPSGDAGELDGAMPEPCLVTAPTTCPPSAPVYADLEPLFAERCVVCHDGRGEEWPLSTYGHVADWYLEIRAAMLSCEMPPADAGVSLTREERERILAWIRCGLPR